MSRIFKVYRPDGQELAMQKGKRYVIKSDGSVVEREQTEDLSATLAPDEIVFAGSKTDIRTQEINDRNVSIMINSKADKSEVYTKEEVYTRNEVLQIIEQAGANLATTPDGNPVIDGGTF